jgi:hypothetical protein
VILESILQRRETLVLQGIAARNGLRLIKHDLFFDLKRENTVLRIRDTHRVYFVQMIENSDY